MTVKEAAKILKRDIQTVRIMVAHGCIPGATYYRKVGDSRNVYIINDKPFLNWVNGNESNNSNNNIFSNNDDAR